jgi:hypothetical protein
MPVKIPGLRVEADEIENGMLIADPLIIRHLFRGTGILEKPINGVVI